MSRDFSIAAAVFQRDLTLAFRSGGGWFYAVFFFVVFVALSALAIGPALSDLAKAAPAIVWLAAAFALQFAAVGMFDVDMKDGTLRAFAAEQQSLAPYWAGKAAVLTALSLAPIVAASPFILVMLGVALEKGIVAGLLLALGAPALIFVALLAAALSAGLKAGGLLAAIIAAPLSAPALIFGVTATKSLLTNGAMWSPETLILAALSLFMAVLTPGFVITSLRLGLE